MVNTCGEMMEKVLVLMATYNGEKYLQEQLDSLYAQKGVEVSIIVRDDGSSDGTIEILKKNSENHNIEWYANGHLGVKYGFYDLMEKAYASANTYIAFCDQDDVWDEDKLCTAVNAIKQNAQKNSDGDIPCLYYCGQNLVDSNLKFLSGHELNKSRTIYARFLLNDAAGCTEVFNFALLKEIVKYKPEYMLMHDAWIVKVCLGIGGNVIVDTNAHMSYRQHGGNVVGLKHDLVSKIKTAIYYINEQDVESQMKELVKGYDKSLTSDYKEIVNDVLNYKKSSKSRKRLLNKDKFFYGERGLQLVYWLKVMLGKL